MEGAFVAIATRNHLPCIPGVDMRVPERQDAVDSKTGPCQPGSVMAAASKPKHFPLLVKGLTLKRIIGASCPADVSSSSQDRHVF